MTDMISFSQLLKILRGSTTLRELEQTSNISNAYLSQLEHGHTKDPSVETVRKLIAIYPNHKTEILKSLRLL